MRPWPVVGVGLSYVTRLVCMLPVWYDRVPPGGLVAHPSTSCSATSALASILTEQVVEKGAGVAASLSSKR